MDEGNGLANDTVDDRIEEPADIAPFPLTSSCQHHVAWQSGPLLRPAFTEALHPVTSE